MLECSRADRIKGSEHSRTAISNEHNFGPCGRRISTHFIKRAANVLNDLARSDLSSDCATEVEHELQRVVHVPMNEWIEVNSYGLKAIAQDVLGAIRDHQVGLQLHDFFNIRIEKRADPLLRCDFRRKFVVIAYRDHFTFQPKGEQHLGDAGHNGNDSLRRTGCIGFRCRDGTGGQEKRMAKP